MGLGLGSLFLATILVLNGLAILNEERFLRRIGWGYEENLQEPPSFKKQVINLLYAVRVLLRVPLLGLNVLTILVKLLMG
ncbi:hypothetical protein KFE25_010491 [Diacronema lutheri]|uniref:Immediate early response 3-interacting protein 1 n=1 Tax=Diacronema lutheri TaxID=2081491 RepID=A0A8J6C5R4_DIALT|nr:hypothetical protein KFE25_010491 [Diacronema lutheri]